MAIPGNMLSATTESLDPNTSGWIKKSNCTISLGSGGRNGDGLLKLTSVASGEMQARTVASYPVTPGVTYWTFADAAGATVPERIGIRWMRQNLTWPATMTEVSVTWSLSTATASSSLHRISVAGVAPATATHAQVLVSATPAGAGVINYFENVYFGLPLRFGGNLLSFNAESGGELDTTAWGVEANCTLSRTAPMVVWPVDWYYSGGHTLTLTVSSNGDASALCVERVPVTSGVDYTAYTYLSPPTTGAACWVELRFYDSGGSQIAAHRSTLAAATTGFQRQIASGLAPANAVTASIAVGITSGTTGQVVRAEGSVVSTVEVALGSTLTTGNVVPLHVSEFEQGVAAWSVASGVATIARSTPWNAQAYFAAYSMQVSSATATESRIRSVDKFPVVEGQSYRILARLNETAGGVLYNHGPRWYDDTDTLISAEFSPSAYNVPGGSWTWASEDFEAPAGAVSAEIELSVNATAGSTVIYIDGVTMWPVLPLMEATADDTTASVQVILRELEVGGLVTVWRVLADGSRTLVRGPDGLLDAALIEADSMVIEDYEAPLGVQVIYEALTTDADGLSNPVRRDSEFVQLDPGNRNYVWLKDPSRPQANMRVLVKTAPAWKQGIRQARYDVRGRAAPVIHSDVRSSREGDLVAWTETDEQREALRFLLSTGNVLLWQSAPGMGETDVYVSIADSAFPRVSDYAPEPWREWTLPMTEVDMPTGGVAGSATWTVHDVAIEFADGYAVLSAFATVFDLAINNRTTA